MALKAIKLEKFRCLDVEKFHPDPGINVVVGANGAGKTSLLEAIYLLGRGRSFRAPQVAALIQNGAQTLTVFGETESPGGNQRLGLQIGAGKTEIHIDGRPGSVADLASALPVQIIEPEVHQLVQGGPDRRRQFIDWGVFHVKHEFLGEWRRYRRALKQRNAALRRGDPKTTVSAWDSELIESGLAIDQQRRAFLDKFEPELEKISIRLFGLPARGRYLPGWPERETFETALHSSYERDRQYGATQIGPHRAELKLIVEEHPARHRLSRGQQKLLGAALVLAQSRFVAEAANIPVILLVDEPAAELDKTHLGNLMEMLVETGLQLFLSALEPEALPIPADFRVFHVEHGDLQTLL